MASELSLLLTQLDHAYDHGTWHGPNLKGSLRGVSSDEAAWRPAPDRHNIWEETVHAAYWKYVVRRRILDEKRGSFDLAGSDWFPCPEPLDAKEWKSARALLQDHHERLRETVAGLSAKDLERPASGSADTLRDMIFGVAFHDVYHAGQIRLLRRMMEDGSPAGTLPKEPGD